MARSRSAWSASRSGARVPQDHAILLTSSSARFLPAWARGLIDVETAVDPEAVTFMDAARGLPSKQSAKFSALRSAFDGAGREALLIAPVRTQRLADDAFCPSGVESPHA
jgi:hypothetical protein